MELSKNNTVNIKGISILVIVMIHILNAFKIYIPFLGGIAVFAFLFVSGYGLSKSMEKNNNIKYYVKRRILKVYIPYVFLILLFEIYFVLSGNLLDLSSSLKMIILINIPEGILWYMQLLMLWYIAFGVIYYLINSNNNRVFCLMICSILFAFISGCNRMFIWQLFSFPLGAMFSYKTFDLKKNKKTIIVLAIIVILALVMKKMPYVEQHELGLVDTILQVIIVTIIGMIYIYAIIKINIKLFYNIGRISYEIYLAHSLLLGWLNKNNSMRALFIYIISIVVISVLIKICELSTNQIIKSRG